MSLALNHPLRKQMGNSGVLLLSRCVDAVKQQTIGSLSATTRFASVRGQSLHHCKRISWQTSPSPRREFQWRVELTPFRLSLLSSGLLLSSHLPHFWYQQSVAHVRIKAHTVFHTACCLQNYKIQRFMHKYHQ